uniref:Uncharacterized protein n=1 Tax=Pithovirus LCDPAC02 TaxID=2506601 RepID=A0A481YP70_9VIRU|nr:MAG: hypothetical protein LCDPAC02_03120 [Pithovirus LCDPAC02]
MSKDKKSILDIFEPKQEELSVTVKGFKSTPTFSPIVIVILVVVVLIVLVIIIAIIAGAINRNRRTF